MKILKIIGIIWLVSTVLVVLLVAFGPKNKDNRSASTTSTTTAASPTATPTPTISVVFDNGTAATARIKVDGKQIASVASYQVGSSALVPVGKHRIEILGTGNKIVDKQTIDIPATYSTAIYNIAGANHYAVYTMGYGSAKVASPRRPLPDKRFFVKEGGVGQLGDGFPSVVKVRKGTGGTTMSVLGHVPIHRGRKCCERLRASLKAS